MSIIFSTFGCARSSFSTEISRKTLMSVGAMWQKQVSRGELQPGALHLGSACSLNTHVLPLSKQGQGSLEAARAGIAKLWRCFMATFCCVRTSMQATTVPYDPWPSTLSGVYR